MTLRKTIDFLLYDWLNTNSLTERARFADHCRETFCAVLDICERIARERYAPFNRLVDIQEPHFDGEKVIQPQATHDATAALGKALQQVASATHFFFHYELPKIGAWLSVVESRDATCANLPDDAF